MALKCFAHSGLSKTASAVGPSPFSKLKHLGEGSNAAQSYQGKEATLSWECTRFLADFFCCMLVCLLGKLEEAMYSFWPLKKQKQVQINTPNPELCDSGAFPVIPAHGNASLA